jgi:hypothetical protein
VSDGVLLEVFEVIGQMPKHLVVLADGVVLSRGDDECYFQMGLHGFV